MSGRVLGPNAYEVFTTPRRLADGRTTGYGCGIETSSNRAGDTVLRHSGRDSGFVSYSVLLPRTRSAVVVLSNRDDSAPWDLADTIVALLNKAHRPPALIIEGPPAEAVARKIFADPQSARVDRRRFGNDFNIFLTDAKVRAAGARLRSLGAPTTVEVADTHERGGMEATTLRFAFSKLKLEVVMFRSVEGKVQQFLIYDR
jgi:D-alanyl-D-alanine carboxypeptidase